MPIISRLKRLLRGLGCASNSVDQPPASTTPCFLSRRAAFLATSLGCSGWVSYACAIVTPSHHSRHARSRHLLFGVRGHTTMRVGRALPPSPYVLECRSASQAALSTVVIVKDARCASAKLWWVKTRVVKESNRDQFLWWSVFIYNWRGRKSRPGARPLDGERGNRHDCC